MAIASNEVPSSMIEEASYILIVIEIITADSVIKTSLKGPEAI